MSLACETVRVTSLAIDEAHRTGTARRSAHRRADGHPLSEPALARGTCRQGPRRDDTGVFPQVASGVRTSSAQRACRARVNNDPLNKSDPTGLRPVDDETFDLPAFDDPCFQDTGVPGLLQGSFGDGPIGCYALMSPGSEGLYCSWQNPSHVVGCFAANNAAMSARREAGERFGSKGDVSPYGPPPLLPADNYADYGPPDGSRGNAFQHMVWNGLMVKYVGREAAKGFADRHEMGTLNADLLLREWELHLRGMDFANNHYGRELAVKILATNPGKNFEERLYDEAERIVRDDQACWISNYDADRQSARPTYDDPSRCGQR